MSIAHGGVEYFPPSKRSNRFLSTKPCAVRNPRTIFPFSTSCLLFCSSRAATKRLRSRLLCLLHPFPNHPVSCTTADQSTPCFACFYVPPSFAPLQLLAAVFPLSTTKTGDDAHELLPVRGTPASGPPSETPDTRLGSSLTDNQHRKLLIGLPVIFEARSITFFFVRESTTHDSSMGS